MLQPCNTMHTTCRDIGTNRHTPISHPPVRFEIYSGPIFPAFTTSEAFSPAHSFQSFHLESKGNPTHLSFAAVACAGPIKERSAVQFFFIFVFSIFNVFVYCSCSFNPTCLNAGFVASPYAKPPLTFSTLKLFKPQKYTCSSTCIHPCFTAVSVFRAHPRQVLLEAVP